jgi:hypothetical protein
VIELALRMKKGDITQAAVYLRIPRHIHVYRIEKYGLLRNVRSREKLDPSYRTGRPTLLPEAPFPVSPACRRV